MERKSWTCFVCNTSVFEGQRIAFTRHGPAHWECWIDFVNNKLNHILHNDIHTIIDIEDFLNIGIIKIKEYERRVKDENLRKYLHDLRKTLEVEGAKFEKLLEERIFS